MKTVSHKALILITTVLFAGLAFMVSAANVKSVSIGASTHVAGATGVLYRVSLTPATAITGPGDLRITFPAGYVLTSIAPTVDISVTGGGVSWDAIINGNLNTTTRVLTLGWSSGTLSTVTPIVVTINFVKNPTTDGTYLITTGLGTDNFSIATDSRTIPFVITNSAVAVSATVPYAETNPTITTIDPTPTIIMNDGDTQVVTFVLTDVNNDNVTYTVTSNSDNSVVLSPPASPISGTQNGVTITFTYVTDGTATGSQTVTITADDNEATGGPLVTQDIDFFII